MGKLWQIALTYLTRPLVWLMIVGYVAITVTMVLQSSQRRHLQSRQTAYPGRLGAVWAYPITDRDAFRGRNPAIARQSRISIQQTQPDVRDRVTPGDLEVLQANRNLRGLSIQYHDVVTDADLAALSRLTELEELALHGGELPETVWEYLGRLPRLRHLDLSGTTVRGTARGLEKLARLQTLVLGSPVHGLTMTPDAPLLSELVRLPRLRRLVFGCAFTTNPGAKAVRGSTTLVEALRELRPPVTLTHIFVEDQASDFPGFAIVQSVVPGVAIRPAWIPWERDLHALITISILTAVAAATLILQGFSHFSSATSRLLPGFSQWHLGSALVAWTILTGIHVWELTFFGIAFPAAIGLQGAFMLFFGLPVLFELSRWRSQAVVPGLLLLVAAAATQSSASSLDWYLRGARPREAWALALSGIATVVLLAVRSSRLATYHLERGRTLPPLSLDPADLVRWRDQSAVDASGWVMTLQNQSLDRAIKGAGTGTRLARWRLWIAANGTTGPRQFSVTLGVFLVIWFGYLILSGRWFEDQQGLSYPPVLLALALAPDFPLLAVGGVWRARQRTMNMELLRPQTRNEYIRQMTHALGWDLLPLAGLYLLLFCLFLVLADPSRRTLLWMAGLILYLASRWLIGLGLLLWVMLIQRGWVAFLILVPAVYGLLLVNIIIVMTQGEALRLQSLPSDLPDPGGLGLLTMAASLGIVALASVWFAGRRWQRLEFH